MILAAEQELKYVGATQGCADHDHDPIHEPSRRLDALWRYNQYIANVEVHDNSHNFWTNFKSQEQHNFDRLKDLITEEVSNHGFSCTYEHDARGSRAQVRWRADDRQCVVSLRSEPIGCHRPSQWDEPCSFDRDLRKHGGDAWHLGY